MQLTEYRQRINKVLALIPEGAMIIRGANHVPRSNDTTFTFRQNSNFKYLTGLHEPDSILVILTNHPEWKSVLFVNPKNPELEMWNGKRLGVDKAQEILEVDKVFANTEFDQEIVKLIDNHRKLYLDLFHDFARDISWNQKIMGILESLASRKKARVHNPLSIHHLAPIIGKLRLIKDDTEIRAMKKAAEINTIAHKAAMSVARPGMNEKEIHALLTFIYNKEGAWGESYESIVASGDNANILHYIDNNSTMKDGDLLLIDAGPEFNTYSSDVTRTFPINGKFSGIQKEVYTAVLDAQKAGFASSQIGSTLSKIHTEAENSLIKSLISLGVFKQSFDEIKEKNLHKKYYPHGTGHWLGLDVHDTSPYLDESLDDITLRSGMVFTVEPGLYFPQEDLNISSHLRGIGIRIEDDLLMTDKGFENLTVAIPKEIKEVEEACASDSIFKKLF